MNKPETTPPTYFHHIRDGTVIDRAPHGHADEVLGRMAPIGHKHINLRGIFSFDLAHYASILLRPGHIINNELVSK